MKEKWKKMSKDVKRGAVGMAVATEQTEDDGDMPILTAICFIGQKFLGNSKLTEDAKTFGFKILFAE